MSRYLCHIGSHQTKLEQSGCVLLRTIFEPNHLFCLSYLCDIGGHQTETRVAWVLLRLAN